MADERLTGVADDLKHQEGVRGVEVQEVGHRGRGLFTHRLFYLFFLFFLLLFSN